MNAENLPSEADVGRYKYLNPALNSLYEEIKDLSRKKPDGIVSKYKISLLNKTLTEIKEILPDDPALSHIEPFSVEELPQYSDVVIMLGQFKAAVERFKNKFFGYDGNQVHRWFTQENPRDVEDEDVEDEEYDQDEDVNDDEDEEGQEKEK